LLIQNIKNELGGSGIYFTRSKLTKVLSKYCRYSKLIIDNIINCEINEYDKDDELSDKNLSCFKYAPVISCDVEWSF